MRIPQIQLVGYKRFNLGNIHSFNMDISAPLQLVLGTNGSGKSSLLDQLSPITPNPNDFVKGGGRKLKIVHDGRTFHLSSMFGQPHPHSFRIEDGPELNEGGTITIQRELVKQYFGITADIHNLLQGRETFTSMSPARRKEWFLRLCDTNYDYAISVYNRLREKARDVSGALKIAKSTLAQESEKLIHEDEVLVLLRDIEQLHTLLNTLLEKRKPIESDAEVLALQQEALDVDLMASARTLESIYAKVAGVRNSVSEYDALIAQAHEELVRSGTLVDRISVEFRENENKIGVLKKADSQSIAGIKDRLAQIEHKLAGLRLNRIASPPVSPLETLVAFQSIKLAVTVTLSEIPINLDMRFSQQKLNENAERQSKLRLDRANAVANSQKYAVQIKHQETHRDNPDLACPKCAHRFSLGYNEVVLKGTLDSLQRCEQAVIEIDAQLAYLDSYAAESNAYRNAFRQMVQLFSSSGLKPYFDWMFSEGYLTTKPRSVQAAIFQIEKDIEAAIEEAALLKEQDDRNQLLQSLEAIGSVDLQTLCSRNDLLSEQISKHTSEMLAAQRKKSALQSEQATLKSLSEYLKKVKELIRKKKTISLEMRETKRRQIFNNLIRHLQSELASKEQIVGAVAIQKGIVRNLSERIEELGVQEKDLALLIKNLSPTEGLIAEGILGFMNNFIDQVNSIISKIWSYPLEIKACDLLEGETIDLDYKFPFVMNDSNDPISDIALGSTGIIEIINLAYRLTAMQYLGLEDYPLYLDEAGSTFDVTHRTEFGKMIRTIIEQNAFSQIFLISHYFELYGGLANVETCVLSSTNIVTPARFNEHVTIS